MYEWAGERLSIAGYAQYEISQLGQERSSLVRRALHLRSCLRLPPQPSIWRNLPYLGFGAGAHGYAADRRTANLLAPAAYNPPHDGLFRPLAQFIHESARAGAIRLISSSAPSPAYPFPLTPATQHAEIVTRRPRSPRR